MDAPDQILRADRISKSYTVWSSPSARLWLPLVRAAAGSSLWPSAARRGFAAKAERMARPFHALRETTFSLKQGESLGIVGRNGSGKSTLLQILAGTLRPTSGSVISSGRVAALLELGTGFNPEFSGRENVMLQGTLAGVSARDMEARFDEVAAFAEIGGFIEQPVKVYSSGMLVRLAFATQTILQPDVFIVDEALAVGDIFFQAKCVRYFREQLARGMSLIFVSHDLSSVKALCQRALVLHQGETMFLGDSARAVSVYHEIHQGITARETGAGQVGSTGAADQLPHPSVRIPAGASERNWSSSDEIGSREMEIVYCQIQDHAGNPRNHFAAGEPFSLTLFIRGRANGLQAHIGIQIMDRLNHVVYGVTTLHRDDPGATLAEGALCACRLEFAQGLGTGDYVLDAVVGWGDRGDGALQQQSHRVGGIAALHFRHLGLRPAHFGPADLKPSIAWLKG